MRASYPNTLKLPVGLWPFHLDFQKRYPLHRLISRMVHVAGEHSNLNGYGINDLMKHNRTWVLNKLTLEFDYDVSVEVPLDITTGVITYSKLSTERALLLSQNDNLLIRGNSRWVALDVQTRRPVPLSEIFAPDVPMVKLDDITIPDIPRQIVPKAVLSKLHTVYTHTISYSDLDINGHMNTSAWIRLAQDAVPLQRWQTGNLHRAHATFNREGLAGEEVTIEVGTEGMTDYCRLSIDGTEAFWLVLEWRDFNFQG